MLIYQRLGECVFQGNVAAQEILAGRGSAGDDRQKLHEKGDYPLRAAEKRALMEIERERATSARLLKERDAAVRRAEQSEFRPHANVQALQTQLGDARQQI